MARKKKQGIFGPVAPKDVPSVTDMKIGIAFEKAARQQKDLEYDPYFDRDCWGDY